MTSPKLADLESTSGGAPGDEYWDWVTTEWRSDGRHALWRAHSDAVTIELLGRWLPQGRVGRVLKTDLFDEAVSDGLVPFLSERAEWVSGIDVSGVTADAAHARYRYVGAVAADVRTLPWASESFDLIFSGSTLDHFATRAEIAVSLGELHRVLKSGGELILTLDNLANPIVALRNALPFRSLNRLGVLPYFVGATVGPRRLRRMVEDAGFQVAEVRALLHCPRALAVAVAGRLDKAGSSERRERFLRLLSRFERLATWPTRFVSGYYIAVRALKR